MREESAGEAPDYCTLVIGRTGLVASRFSLQGHTSEAGQLGLGPVPAGVIGAEDHHSVLGCRVWSIRRWCWRRANGHGIRQAIAACIKNHQSFCHSLCLVPSLQFTARLTEKREEAVLRTPQGPTTSSRAAHPPSIFFLPGHLHQQQPWLWSIIPPPSPRTTKPPGQFLHESANGQVPIKEPPRFHRCHQPFTTSTQQTPEQGLAMTQPCTAGASVRYLTSKAIGLRMSTSIVSSPTLAGPRIHLPAWVEPC